ncbi:hypothetical protein [Brevibacillus massiliensis]|nr:hypothetical protein [Brevibacillus massiliensis]
MKSNRLTALVYVWIQDLGNVMNRERPSFHRSILLFKPIQFTENSD